MITRDLRIREISVCCVYQQRETRMTNQAAREVFNQVIANEADADKIARLEVCREYFTNPTFRKALQDRLWENRK